MGRLFWLAHETTTKINHLSLIIVLLLRILSLPLGPHAVQKYLVALTNVAMAYLERRGERKFDLATTTQFTMLLFAASSDIRLIWAKMHFLHQTMTRDLLQDRRKTAVSSGTQISEASCWKWHWWQGTGSAAPPQLSNKFGSLPATHLNSFLAPYLILDSCSTERSATSLAVDHWKTGLWGFNLDYQAWKLASYFASYKQTFQECRDRMQY